MKAFIYLLLVAFVLCLSCCGKTEKPQTTTSQMSEEQLAALIELDGLVKMKPIPKESYEQDDQK
jgi:hypothetical protein